MTDRTAGADFVIWERRDGVDEPFLRDGEVAVLTGKRGLGRRRLALELAAAGANALEGAPGRVGGFCVRPGFVVLADYRVTPWFMTRLDSVSLDTSSRRLAVWERRNFSDSEGLPTAAWDDLASLVNNGGVSILVLNLVQDAAARSPSDAGRPDIVEALRSGGTKHRFGTLVVADEINPLVRRGLRRHASRRMTDQPRLPPLPSQAEWVAALDLRRRGSEAVGPCPLCGGTDRFHVSAADRFGCRQCYDGEPEAIKAERTRLMLRAAFPDRFPDRTREGAATRRPAVDRIPEPPDGSDDDDVDRLIPDWGKMPAEPKARTGNGAPTATWPYFNQDGTAWAYKTRFERDGTKSYAWFHERGGKRINKRPDKPEAGYPLFDHPELRRNPDAEVLIVEGEKAASCVNRWREADPTIPIAVSFQDSQVSSIEKHDLTPLRGRTVTVSADDDDTGRKFAKAVAGALGGICKKVRLALPDGDSKRDVADFPTWAEASKWIDENLVEKRLHNPLFSYAEVEMKDWQWLWPDWIPKGELALIGGAPEAGKGLLSSVIAAQLSRGRLPDDTAMERPQNIVIVQSEEDDERTIAPRLGRHGADMRRIHGFVPVEDATPMQTIMASIALFKEVDLILVDPITQGMTGNINEANTVRQHCESWADIARHTGAAVLGVIHTAKFAKRRLTEGTHADLIAGSQQWAAVPRFLLGLFPEPETNDRLLIRLKSNCDTVDKRDGYRVKARMTPQGRVIDTPLTVEYDVLNTVADAISEKSTPNVREALLREVDDMRPGEFYSYPEIRGRVQDETDCTRQAIDKQAKRLAKESIIVIHATGRGSPIQWTLPG